MQPEIKKNSTGKLSGCLKFPKGDQKRQFSVNLEMIALEMIAF
jgi:hypothetical protein